MQVGTILLTRTNQYAKEDGSLPTRPRHDKELLSCLINGRRVSKAGYSLLPSSMQQLCRVTLAEPIMPITIKELAECELLIISRSAEEFESSKVFRLDNFKCLVKDRKVELWISIK